MSTFVDGSYGTQAGIALIAKVLAGRCKMKYTRAAVGKGKIPGDKTPKTMPGPAEFVLDAKIASISNPVNGECQVTVQIKSDQVQEGFYATNIVLFAEDPDLGEVPYTYLLLENEPEWIRPSSSIIGKLATFDLIAAVGDIDAVSASLDLESIATTGEVKRLIAEHNSDSNAHDGSVGGGCSIKITFDSEFSGKKYTISDGHGDTKTRVVPESLVDTVNVKNCNTAYTIRATVNDEEYTSIITTGAYFGQYNAALSVFTATIKVTAVSGARVTVTHGEYSFSGDAGSNGIAEITVKKAGNYSVSGTIFETTSNITTVNVTTNGGSYSTTIKFITLTVTSPTGSQINVSKGSTNLSAVSTGSNKFYLNGTGNWDVSISKNSENAHDVVNVTTYRDYTIEMAFVHIYGVQWDGTSTTKWTRTDEASSFTDPVPYMPGVGNYGSPFDSKKPWSGMIKSERTGGTMVAIPKFWYKITQSGSGMKVQIADKATPGFSVSPAHTDRKDSKGERDIVYVGRYHCSEDSYKSKSGRKPKANITRSTARSSIHSLGSNIWQMDFAMRFTLWLLYIVEFADWNSQAKIGYGCGNNSATENMGYTDSMPYHTGTTKSSRTTYGLGTQYRYIEGLWDNVLDWCDGCYYNGNGMNIIIEPNRFSDDSGGVSVGTPINGYPSAFSVKTGGAFPMFIPTATSGSDSTYSCDYWYFSSSCPCIYVGGNFSQSSYYGLFCIDYTSTSNTSTFIGSRLQELP